MRAEFLNLCDLIIETSMYWTGEDEEKNPGLKTIRTLAGHYLSEYKDVESLDKTIIDYLSARS